MSTSFSYQNHLGQTGAIKKGINLNQHFSYLHQSKEGLWSFFINRDSFSGSILSDQTDVSLTNFEMGLNYTKDFSFGRNDQATKLKIDNLERLKTFYKVFKYSSKSSLFPTSFEKSIPPKKTLIFS